MNDSVYKHAYVSNTQKTDQSNPNHKTKTKAKKMKTKEIFT